MSISDLFVGRILRFLCSMQYLSRVHSRVCCIGVVVRDLFFCFFFCFFFGFFFFKQKTAYEIRNCDWSSDVCSSDLKGFGAVIDSHGNGNIKENLGSRWLGLQKIEIKEA